VGVRTIEEVIEKLARDRDDSATPCGSEGSFPYEDEADHYARVKVHEYAKELLAFILSDSGLVHKGSTQRIRA
jgi:hypothetical protein